MSVVNETPHTIEDQIKKLEGLLVQRRQEQLAGDQSDVDLALDNDDLPPGVDNSWAGNHARLVTPIEGGD